MVTVCEIMQRILRGVEKCCTDRELSVNPMMSMVLFTRKYKPEALCPMRFYGKELDLKQLPRFALGI